MLSLSQFCAQIPIINPNREKLIEVNAIKIAIISGYFISCVTKKFEVKNIIRPIIVDFVAAAPTYPIVASNADTGAERTSKIDPVNFGKYIPKAALFILSVIR